MPGRLGNAEEAGSSVLTTVEEEKKRSGGQLAVSVPLIKNIR